MNMTKVKKIRARMLGFVLSLALLISTFSVNAFALKTTSTTGSLGGYTCVAVLSQKNSARGAYASTAFGTVTDSIYTSVSYTYKSNNTNYTVYTSGTSYSVQSNLKTTQDMSGTFVSASSYHKVTRSGYPAWTASLSI